MTEIENAEGSKNKPIKKIIKPKLWLYLNKFLKYSSSKLNVQYFYINT